MKEDNKDKKPGVEKLEESKERSPVAMNVNRVMLVD